MKNLKDYSKLVEDTKESSLDEEFKEQWESIKREDRSGVTVEEFLNKIEYNYGKLVYS